VMKGFFSVCAIILLLLDGFSMASVSVVKNGSFENDGPMSYIAPDQRPEYWCDVSYDDFKFGAYVWDDWASHGNYSLTMYNFRGGTFQPNDAVTVSQSVYLASAGQIILDITLFTLYGDPWDTNAVTARVLIDDFEVWNSDGLQFTAGQFTGEIVIDVNQMFKDENAHVLSLQLRPDVSNLNLIQYFSQWDFIRFSTACGGAGFLPADFTRDCVVDIYDLKIFAVGWLDPDGPDLTGDAAVDFADFAVLADSWMVDNSGPEGDPCYLDPDFVFLDADLNDDGIVDYGDIFVFSNGWLNNGGPCVRADLNRDGIIDLADFAILAEYWQQTGSLYD